MQYIEDIVDDINNKYKQQNCDTRLNKIILWMDNCAGQFKSKYFFGYLMQYAQNKSIDFLINYFAEQHGKVPVHYIFQPFFAQPSPTDTPVNPHPFYACPCPLFLRTPVMVKPRLPRHTWTFCTVMKSTNTSPLLSLLSSCKQTERLLSRVMGVYMLLLADFLNFIGMGRYANTTT